MQRLEENYRAPRHFIPAGTVAEVELAEDVPFKKAEKGVRGARRAGLVYEAKAHGYLAARYGGLYIPSRWLRFRNGSSFSWRYCQPDGFIFDLRSLHITLIEIKLKHTPLAWWQLRQLYEPVLRKLFGNEFSYSCCEVVKWFDPHVAFPEKFKCSPTPHAPPQERFAVHIWGGR